jgi:OmpA-OmpF porin, OOP family
MNYCGYWFLVFSVIIFSKGSAQNLVPNGSFEDYRACPGSFSELPSEFMATSWRPLTTGSPDYFNTCSEGEAAVPYNWAGVSDAFDGYGYAGIYTWMNLQKDYREYLHCKLIQPLIKDTLYVVEFHYKLSSYSKFSIDRIGLLLSDSLKRIAHDRPIGIRPSVCFLKDSALTPETGSWESAVAEYRAEGNEQFLTIGNFSSNEETHYYHIRFRAESQPMVANSAYYYVDDVKVVPKFSPVSPIADLPLFAGGEPLLNTGYVLRNIAFEFNSYALLRDSYADLDEVIAYLQNHPQLSVVLTGHTDDVGTSEYNRLLSYNRAKTAAAYFVSKGIEKSRISTIGYGENKPLVQGEDQAARNVNRRVEIEFHR